MNNIKNLNEVCNIVVKTPVGKTEEATVTSIVQQGSVSGGVLCTASTAEITQEKLGGGCQIGEANMKALTFVDDIATPINEYQDLYTSNNSVAWFSSKKRLSLNVPKCKVLPVNTKPTDVIPRLKINNIVLQCVEKAEYLGDMFSDNGRNNKLIEERAKKGQSCIISAFSMCNEVTLGVHSIQTLLLLYKSLFIPVVLNNSRAWSNLTNQNILSLQTTQLKYLKRIFHAPRSTPNAVTFLETGSLPIEHEINVRRLNFLHHILTLTDNDPVKVVYGEQLKYKFEANWANNMEAAKRKYKIGLDREEVAAMSRAKWKNLVKRKVAKYALDELNCELAQLKVGSKLKPYNELMQQEYMGLLFPEETRVTFQIRSGVVDFKTVRKYWYDDCLCRLCKQGNEDVDHVVNACPEIPRSSNIDQLFTNDLDSMKEIAKRCVEFFEKIGTECSE